MSKPFLKLRGLSTPLLVWRRKIYEELARLVVQNKVTQESVEAIPYKIITADAPSRCCSFRSRAIVRERLRLVCGLDLPKGSEHEPNIPDISTVAVPEKVAEGPFVHVLNFACEKCPEDIVKVSDICRNCLARPCHSACPEGAISEVNGRAFIDQSKCTQCGSCIQVCPYEAIVHHGRPCTQACGVNAIKTAPDGTAMIDYDKCVSCGLCSVSCPFGAIADKSELLQVLVTLRDVKDRKKVAVVAPAFVSQFGSKVTPEAVFEGLRRIGFDHVVEAAHGADIDVKIEAKKLADKIARERDEGAKKTFISTSCCPSWVKTVNQFAPEIVDTISESFSPMAETAQLVKKRTPDARVVFIGPCVSKKTEALQERVRPYVDHVLTFEETAAVFQAHELNLQKLNKEAKPIKSAGKYGRGFAIAKGVAGSVSEYASLAHGVESVDIARADTLEDCRAILTKIKKGDIQADLVEGMACPNGCCGGPGTIAPIKSAMKEVRKFMKKGVSAEDALGPDALH